MNSALDHADAVLPSTRTAFGRRLRPLTLGHATLLSQLQNPWIEGRSEDLDCTRSVEAATICAMPWRKAARAVRRSMDLGTMIRVWYAIGRCNVSLAWYAKQIAQLAAYFHENVSGPTIKGKSNRSTVKVPAWAMLKTMAQHHLHMDSDAAMDSTPSELMWGLGCLAASMDREAWMTDDDADLIERAKTLQPEELFGGN